MANIKSKKKTADKKDLSRKAYTRIRQMLFNDDIIPGQKISYSDLAKQLGMSTTPIIQALNQLELLGLVRRELNKGYYIEPANLKQIQDHDNIFLWL